MPPKRRCVEAEDAKEEIRVHEPYGWQLEVIKIIKEKPDKRKIYWFYESDGNMGKSALCKYLVVRENAIMLAHKAKYTFQMLHKYPSMRKLILVDVRRSAKDSVDYAAIDQIKDGLICGRDFQLAFNHPHVICFCNSLPPKGVMSADRWRVFDIRNNAYIDFE